MKSDISEISNINKILLNFDTKSCKWDKCVFLFLSIADGDDDDENSESQFPTGRGKNKNLTI